MKTSDSPVRLRALAGQLPESLQLALEPLPGDEPSPRQLRQLASSIERRLGASPQVASAPATPCHASRKGASSRVIEIEPAARASKRGLGARRWWTTFGVCAGISVAVAAAAKLKSSLDDASVAASPVAIALPHVHQLRVKTPSPRLHEQAQAPASNSSGVAAPVVRESPAARGSERAKSGGMDAAHAPEPHVPEPISVTAGARTELPESSAEAMAHPPSASLETKHEIPVGSAQWAPPASVVEPMRPSAESELGLLKRAQMALGANPGLALELTSIHAGRFPSGALAQEREVIAIDALMRLGRTSEATRRGSAFQTRYPASAHARRIKVLLGSR